MLTADFGYPTEYDPKGGYYEPTVLSDDGRFAKNRQTLSSITGNTVTEIGFLNSVAYDFRPDNNDELIFRGTPTTILKTSDLTTLRVISPPVPGYFRRSYDPATKMMLYMGDNSNEVYLINIDTQEVTTVKARSNSCVSLVNGILFDFNGYYIKVL